jgi:hypothetical protein
MFKISNLDLHESNMLYIDIFITEVYIVISESFINLIRLLLIVLKMAGIRVLHIPLIIKSVIERNDLAYYDCLTGCLFFTCTEGIFFLLYRIHTHYILQYSKHAWICIEERIRPLTWNSGSLYMAANSHPCRSLAQSQLPHLRPPPLIAS